MAPKILYKTAPKNTETKTINKTGRDRQLPVLVALM
jgi:hypothetical protein